MLLVVLPVSFLERAERGRSWRRSGDQKKGCDARPGAVRNKWRGLSAAGPRRRGAYPRPSSAGSKLARVGRYTAKTCSLQRRAGIAVSATTLLLAIWLLSNSTWRE